MICIGYPAFIKNRRGLKKIPPPIPTIPDIKRMIDPIIIEINLGILSADLKTGHSITFFLRTILLNYNKDEIEIFLISNQIVVSHEC